MFHGKHYSSKSIMLLLNIKTDKNQHLESKKN